MEPGGQRGTDDLSRVPRSSVSRVRAVLAVRLRVTVERLCQICQICETLHRELTLWDWQRQTPSVRLWRAGWNAAAWRRQLLDLIRVVHPDKPSKSQTELTQILTGMLAEVEARGDVSAAEEKPPSQQRSPKRKM